jgi:hypothetical protein
MATVPDRRSVAKAAADPSKASPSSISHASFIDGGRWSTKLPGASFRKPTARSSSVKRYRVTS